MNFGHGETQVPFMDWSPGVGSVQWFPEESMLLVYYTLPDTRDWFLNAVDPRSLDLTLLASDEVISRYSARNVRFSPDGKRIILPSYRDGWLHLYAMPASGGELEQITRGEWDLQTNINSPRFFDVPSQGEWIFFTSSAVHPLEKHLFSVSLNSGESQRLSPDKRGTYTPYASPDGRYVVVDYSAVDVPNDLYLIDTSAPGEMKRITSSPRPEFADILLVKPKYCSFTNPNDGVTVHYRMLAPPNFDESSGRKYPVVFTHMYVDEGKNGWSRYRAFEAFLATEMQYLVVSLDGRGSSGHGREFAAGRYPRERTTDVEDHLEAGKYMKTLPYVDACRVGAWGKSYGGDLALMVLFQEPGVFDTSVCIQPVTRRPRAVYQPERLQANLLLIDSSLDTTVYFREMALMMQMLIDSGKYADFWLYPKEDHSLALRDEAFKDTMKRIAQYFEDHWGAGRSFYPDDSRLGW
jgi:dipeptidyl-peptidase-4